MNKNSNLTDDSKIRNNTVSDYLVIDDKLYPVSDFEENIIKSENEIYELKRTIKIKEKEENLIENMFTHRCNSK
jgi:hypothetical protein